MSDVTGLEITRLNAYSVASALLVRVKGDVETLRIVSESVGGLDEYVKSLDMQSTIGLVPHADVLRGQVELGRISSDMIRMKEAIADEYAALRKMLGFSLDQKFDIEAGDDTESRYESQAATSVLMTEMYNRALERTQLEYLHQAALSGVNEARWAFLGGCTGNSTSISPGTTGTGAFAVSTGLSISIGFGYFPTISIAKRNVTDIEIREKELQLEIGRQLETVLADIEGEKTRLANAMQAEAAAQALLNEQNYLLDLGRVTVRERLDAITALGRARSEVVSARTTLAGHRITLKRVALEGRFLDVTIAAKRDLEIKKLITKRSGD
jgi:outer membrane protein TolC